MHATILASEDKLAIRDVLEYTRGSLELVKVVVCKSAVTLVLVQHTLRVGSIPLVLQGANGNSAVMQAVDGVEWPAGDMSMWS